MLEGRDRHLGGAGAAPGAVRSSALTRPPKHFVNFVDCGEREAYLARRGLVSTTGHATGCNVRVAMGVRHASQAPSRFVRPRRVDCPRHRRQCHNPAPRKDRAQSVVRGIRERPNRDHFTGGHQDGVLWAHSAGTDGSSHGRPDRRGLPAGGHPDQRLIHRPQCQEDHGLLQRTAALTRDGVAGHRHGDLPAVRGPTGDPRVAASALRWQRQRLLRSATDEPAGTGTQRSGPGYLRGPALSLHD